VTIVFLNYGNVDAVHTQRPWRLEVGNAPNIIRNHLELHVNNNHLRVDCCAPKCTAEEPVESALESIATLMFWMIIAPELVLEWAVRQFFAAREI
jgi:hypothetical protein